MEASQTRAIADALMLLRRQLSGGGGRGGGGAGPWSGRSLSQLLDTIEAEMDAAGLDALTGGSRPGDLARPRRFELAAAINRLRTAQLRQLAAG